MARKPRAVNPAKELEEAMEADINVRTARIGIEIEAAKRSPLGQLLIARARQQALEARDAMVLTPVTDVPAMLELQIAARMGDAIEQWIEDTIERGHVATAQILAEEAEEGA